MCLCDIGNKEFLEKLFVLKLCRRIRSCFSDFENMSQRNNKLFNYYTVFITSVLSIPLQIEYNFGRSKEHVD